MYEISDEDADYNAEAAGSEEVDADFYAEEEEAGPTPPPPPDAGDKISLAMSSGRLEEHNKWKLKIEQQRVLFGTDNCRGQYRSIYLN